MADLNFIDTSDAEIKSKILTDLENGVSDSLYPGDERRIFGEALAGVVSTVFSSVNDACRQKMLRYARGNVLDALGQNRDVKRLEAKFATTTLKFSVSSAATDDILIPKGVRVSSDLKRYFLTASDSKIPSGSSNAYVLATAESVGEDFNGILAGTINSIIDVSTIPLVDSVTNTTITSGGADEEDDDNYRERIRESENKLSTAGPEKAYKYYAISANSKVTDAVVISEDETIERKLTVYGGHAFMGGDQLDISTLSVLGASSGDYTATYSEGLLNIELKGIYTSQSEITVTITRGMAGRVKIVPVCENGEIPDSEVLSDVLSACSADDVKPLTDKVIVEAPSVENYDISLKYYTNQLDESAIVAAVEGEGGAIDQYNHWQSSNVNKDINPDYLRKLILTAGADRVVITKPVYKELGKTTIAKFSGTKTVTHEVK